MDARISDSLREKLVRKIISEFPKTAAIYLYGSAAKAALNRQSDLDLAILMPPGETISSWKLFEMRADLEAAAGRPVDVVELDLAKSTAHSKEVIAQGQVIYCSDERARAEFEMRVLSEYAQYRRDLAPVIRAYSAGSDG